MEVTTQVPGSGTKLRIEADRSFDGQPGDSVLRIEGQREGSQVFYGSYVEVNPEEALLVSWMLRNVRSPTPELTEKLAKEVQATYSSKLSGRDAKQIAEIAWSAVRHECMEALGGAQSTQHGAERKIELIAERFERAAAHRLQPYAGGGTGGSNGESSSETTTGGTSSRSSSR